MASEIGLKLVVGAALAGSFQAVLGGAKKTVADLGAVAERLQSRHERLGGVMARAMASPGRPLGDLHRRYEALGRTLDQIRQKTEALNRSMERGAALKAGRDEKLGAMRETAGATLAVGAPVIKAVMDAAAFGDAVKDIAIVGELSPDAENRLGASLRKTAVDTNQSAVDLAGGIGKLIAEGMAVDKAAEQAALLGRFTTATRASFDDAAKMMVSFDTLGVSAKDMELAFSQAAAAGKLGSFEVRDMAKWFPQLGGLMKGLGVTGNEAVVSMASRLQIAMKTAGSTDEAANNLKNFLAKLTSADTIKAFEDVGVDLQGSMLRLARQGMDPIEGAVGIVMDRIGKQSPAVAAELAALGKEMAAIKDPAERAAEMERRRTMIEALGARTGMGEMFRDLQAVSYLLAEVQNRDTLKEVRAGTESGRTAGGQLAVDADFAKRMESPLEQFKALKIGLTEIGLSIGEALLPALLEIVEAVRPVVRAVADFAKANPALIKSVIGVALALTAGKLAVLGIGWAVSFLVLSPLNGLRTALLTVGGRWLWLKGLWQAGAFAPAVRAISSLGTGFMRALPMAAAFGKGLWMAVYMPFKLLAQGGFVLAKLLGGALLSGLRLAGQAVLFLGRALLMNPIGLAVTVIAGAAYLIWRNWDRLGPMFARLWGGIKAGAAAAWAGIKSAFLNFTPLGLVIKHWQPLMAWFRNLPAAFLGFGAAMVEGLVNGIKNKLAAAGEAIKSVGASVRDTFKGMLGIRSPSRVFAEMGGNLSEGLSLGMTAKLGAVTKAAAGMVAAASVSVAGAAVPGVPDAAMPRPGVAAGAGAGMVVHYAPVLTIHATNSEAGAVRQEAEKALSMSLVEFEKMMRRYEADKQRRGVK